MREILFKAKRIDGGEWVEGNLVLSKDAEEGWEAIIIPKLDSNMFTKGGAKGNLGFENWHRVDENTICQYTGLTDKNGNKIWENDIVESTYNDTYEGIDCGIGLVEFYQGLWYVGGDVQNALYDIDQCNAVEVIGNVFDNPELLKGV